MAVTREKCQHYLPHKRRNCKFDVVPGKRWCGNHLPAEESGWRRRVPCPWDPKAAHDIFEDEVERHKGCCPAYLQLQAQRAAPYYKEDINAGVIEKDPLTAFEGASLASRRVALAGTLDHAQWKDLIERVSAAAKELKAPCLSVLNQEEAERPNDNAPSTVSPFSAKHAMQQASIVGHMDRYGLLRSPTEDAFIELGAGRGYLGAALSRHCSDLQTLVLVDCRGFKLKADRQLRHLDLHRLRCDLKDFYVGGCAPLSAELPQADCSMKNKRMWVGLAKHLCGAATDFALRAAVEQGSLKADRATFPMCRGVGIATCCHHRCTWQSYTGKEWLVQRGFSPLEFELISWMTGWALCGHEAPAGFGGGDEESENDQRDNEEEKKLHEDPGTHVSSQRNGTTTTKPEPSAISDRWDPLRVLPRANRVVLGQQCKALIDAGRLDYLISAGFVADCAAYIAPEVSGENKILLARRADTTT